MKINSQTLFQRVISEENIYKAIYSLESYISERNLLNEEDFARYILLKDKYNFEEISKVIKECQDKLRAVLQTDEFFTVSVFFKIKKLGDNKKVEYRPLHTASLIDQICMASLLMPLMFDDSKGTRRLSELARIIPHNFYGNIPSKNVSKLFVNWKDKYRDYSKIINDKCKEYSRTREYDQEISLDLKDFFPSVNPCMIFDFIWNKLSRKYQEEDKNTLKVLITKLLYFTINHDNLITWSDVYYPKESLSTGNIPQLDNGKFINRGIAQGLPQSYFFGNLCMIEVAAKMNSLPELVNSDAYFYVDDSVVFAKNIDDKKFHSIIINLNKSLENNDQKYDKNNIALSNEYIKAQDNIHYQIKFHEDGKSTICNIEDSFNGLEGLYLVQRPISMGGWILGNIDEIDDNVAFKKLGALQEAVDNEILKIKKFQKSHTNLIDKYNRETRLKWLRRYRRYFLFRQLKLKINLNGNYDQNLVKSFYQTFKIQEINNNQVNLDDEIENIFESFEEEIFKTEIELLVNEMPQSNRILFIKEIQAFEEHLAKFSCGKQRNVNYLYYHRITDTIKEYDNIIRNGYESLTYLVKRVMPYRNSEKLLEDIQKESANGILGFLTERLFNSDDMDDVSYKRCLPNLCYFVFVNSNEFIRKILNCCFSISCNVPVSDNLSIIRNDIKPIKYYELRILSVLRNKIFDCGNFINFFGKIDRMDMNEKMDIDLGLLEAIGLFRQRVQDPYKIDNLILTHRIVKSLWHNGSKFLNAYTLHNQEHAINLIKNIVRIVNNIDYINLKSIDYFLVFQACYLHDISMVVHPNVACFNESNPNSEKLISKWLDKLIGIDKKVNDAFCLQNIKLEKIHSLRKEVGRSLVEAFQDVFNFFENKVRNTHAYDSSVYIRLWNKGVLNYLSEMEAEVIAVVSDSHGWNTTDVYTLKSNAKEELVSLKYMMILIRIADLLDLANDRIDYYLLKQNRSQMGLTSRYHWISHLITDKYELDVDYNVNKKKRLDEHPIEEKIHLDIHLNTEILASFQVCKKRCENILATKVKRTINRIGNPKEEHDCIEYSLFVDKRECASLLCKEISADTRSCPFLCLWMSNKHEWLFTEMAKLKHYLNSVNSNLISSDIVIRFFYSNTNSLDPEFYDDIKKYLCNE